MALLDTDFIKRWCRIDGTEFDAILPTLIDSAVILAGHETGRDYAVVEIPLPVQSWCAAQVAYWIDQPTAATERQMMKSPFVDGLLDPYRAY